MTKAEIIAKARDAIVRLEKSKDPKAAYIASFDAAILRLTDTRKMFAKAATLEEVDVEEMWDNIGTARRILETISYGYPMVPAEDVTVAKTATKNPIRELDQVALLAFVATQFEKAAAEPAEKALPRLRALKNTLFAWEELPEGEQLVPVEYLDGAGDVVVTVATEPAAIGKGASEPPAVAAPVVTAAPAPVTVSEPVAAPGPVLWGWDLNRKV